MYKKLFKIFVSQNISNFLIIIFCVTLSLTWFLVSENLIKNIQTLIGNEAKPILWWDIKLDIDIPLSDAQKWYIEALERDNKIVLSQKSQAYTTITDIYDNPSIVSLLFLDNKYPLYGILEVEKFSTPWVFVSQNVQDLFVKNGKIEIYGKIYTVGWIIKKFPETGFNFYDDGKKVLLPIEEFELLKIEQLWARLDREHLIKVVNENDFDSILSGIKENPIFEWVRVRDYKRWGDRLSDTFSELDVFIKYILIVSFLLTIIIIFLSVEAFYIGNKKVFSILKILGIKNKNVLFFNISLFITTFIIALVISIFFTNAIFVFVRSFELSKEFFIYSDTIIKTIILGGIIVTISVFLPMYKFFSNDPLAGLKENFLQIYSKKEIAVEIGFIILGSLLIYILIVWDIIGWLIFTTWAIASFFVFAYSIKKLLSYLFKRWAFLKKKSFAVYDSIRNTIKPWNLSILVVFSFVISFSSILFISIVSLNFLERLNLDIKSDNNLYIINLKQSDLNALDDMYKENAYSIILGRILAINGKDIKIHLWESSESRQFTREFNITDNALSSVKILRWEKVKTGEVSLDDDFAQSLNVGIGDEIEFFVYGIKKKLKVVNIRESQVSWANPFFYFQVFPDDFKNFPKNYFVSTFIEEQKMKEFKNDFLAKTGNHISFIDIGEIVKEIKSISQKVLIIVQVLFFYTFAFCVIALFVSIMFLIPFKRKKSLLYSVLWANKKFLEKNNIFEYLYLEWISLVISLCIASIGAYFLLKQSNFLTFGWWNYALSFGIVILLGLWIMLGIYFFIGKFIKKGS